VADEGIFLQAEANLEWADDGHFTQVARAWGQEALAHLMPDLDQRLGNGEPKYTTMSAVLPTFTAAVEVAAYTPQRWSAIMAGLGRRPAGVGLEIFDKQALDEEAEAPDRGRLSVDSATMDGRWGTLLTVAGADGDAATEASYYARWVDFLAVTLDQANPAFGVVSDDFLVQATALDLALGRSYEQSLDDSRRLLRGYGFITVVPAELVDRLSGVSSLAGSGAFARVKSLAAGGAVLQATATLPQFDDEALRRVFWTLAPVLPSGIPHPLPGYEDIRVVYQDAAS